MDSEANLPLLNKSSSKAGVMKMEANANNYINVSFKNLKPSPTFEIDEMAKSLAAIELLKPTPFKSEDFQRTLSGHSKSVRFVVYSPDGKYLASASFDKTIKVWNVSNVHEEFTLLGHTDVVYSVSFSSDGNLLVSASSDKKVKIWSFAEKH